MAILKPFRGVRPPRELVKKIASKPYDVLNTEEARKEAEGNPISFLRVIKPEIEFESGFNPHAPEVYQKGRENFSKAVQSGLFIQDKKEHFYIYMLIKDGQSQTGIVGCLGIEDYFNDVILKHELTLPDKEEDRKKHIKNSRIHAEPVMFAYQKVKAIDKAVEEVKKARPEYNFIADDGVRHVLWIVENEAMIKNIIDEFERIPHIYVADGHHRTAAAAIAGRELQAANRNHQGVEEYNFFLAVLFPDDQLKIIDYNRVVKDLNGHDTEEFLELIGKSFNIKSNGPKPYKPKKPHEFGMYISGNWFVLNAKKGTYDENDTIRSLDVTILSEQIFEPILGIADLRKDTRIDFVGGIRGLEELQYRVDSGEMVIAFALYPVSMKQLIKIADSGEIMPPKTTWFEPKLRSGLIVHLL